MKHFVINSLCVAVLASQVSGCVGLMAAGAAGGATAGMDRRGLGTNAQDKQIEFRASNMLTEKFPDAHINSEVFNRNVLLTGEVPTADMGRQAEALVRTIANVNSVSNELAVGPKSNLASRSADAAITTKVKARFLQDRLTQSSAFVVTTERGNVYLQGRVTQAEAARATELARSVGGVRHVVKLFDYLTDEQFKQVSR